MKYFLDTEFIEGFKKPISWLPTIGKFNKPYHSIQLISIGIVAEDGREYYAVSNEFRLRDANDWVLENVIKPIYDSHETQAYNIGKHIPGLWYDYRDYTPKRLKRILKWKGKTNEEIALDIRNFVYAQALKDGGQFILGKFFPNKIEDIEFYAYFADYDWVVFCSLFGTMLSLPKGFPMYCRDLKQSLDEKAAILNQIDLTSHLFSGSEEIGWVLSEGAQIGRDVINIDDYTLSMRLNIIKSANDCPKQENEHNALDDARWNKKLYDFLLK